MMWGGAFKKGESYKCYVKYLICAEVFVYCTCAVGPDALNILKLLSSLLSWGAIEALGSIINVLSRLKMTTIDNITLVWLFYDFWMTVGWLWDDFGMTSAWPWNIFGMTLEWLWNKCRNQDVFGITSKIGMTLGWFWEWLCNDSRCLCPIGWLWNDFWIISGWLLDDFYMTLKWFCVHKSKLIYRPTVLIGALIFFISKNSICFRNIWSLCFYMDSGYGYGLWVPK